MAFTFDFPFHQLSDEFPTNSTIVQFGRGYSFASKPSGPPQVTFHLNFPLMMRYLDRWGKLDKSYQRRKNMEALIAFYEYHQVYEPFVYPHASRGDVRVRFLTPLQVPKPAGPGKVVSSRDGYTAHATDAFSVDLIMLP